MTGPTPAGAVVAVATKTNPWVWVAVIGAIGVTTIGVIAITIPIVREVIAPLKDLTAPAKKLSSGGILGLILG
jgi:nitrate/nitrite-specific signal transduction histidine kinase